MPRLVLAALLAFGLFFGIVSPDAQAEEPDYRALPLPELTQRAEAGDAKAQYNLGVLYGNRQDFQRAAYWVRKAAEQGNTDAQDTLGSMYTMGWGVPKDWVLAYALLYLAAKSGDTNAMRTQERIAAQMSPEQIAEGQVIANQWKVGQPFPSASKTGR